MTARVNAIVLAGIVAAVATPMVQAADFISPNFVVHAPTEPIARQVAAAAEHYRKLLAVTWYGHEIKNWGGRCDIVVKVGRNLGAGGATRFKFDRGEVYDWRMEVQGSLERILDSVIPHEVNHTILACYFRRKVPRWADEGAATIIEHESERQRQIDLVEKLIHHGRRIPLRVLFEMKNYPDDSDQLMALYAQGYTLTEYLLQKGGRQLFLNFLNDAHQRGWNAAVTQFYKARSIEELERDWSGWIVAGMPRLNLPEGQMLASNEPDSRAASQTAQALVARGQNPGLDSAELDVQNAAGSSVVAMANSGTTTDGSIVRPAVSRGSATIALASATARQHQFGLKQSAPDPRSLFAHHLRSEQLDPPGIPAPGGRESAPTSNFVPVPSVDSDASGLRDGYSGEGDDDDLQPLGLRRVSDRRSSDSMPDRFPRQQFGAIRQTSTAGTSSLQETELRSTAPAQRPTETAHWQQFPSRLR
jgi:hypothetical protein